MTTYYFKRIVNNKVKLAVILLIFILPIVDILFILKDISAGGSVYIPDLTSFLATCIYSGSQILLLWFLPLYFLLISADDCIEDYKTGYRNMLVTKWGKKKYFWFNIIKSFVVGFFVIFLSLALNMLLTQIAFEGGTYTAYGHYEVFMQFVIINPFLTNWIYILMTSLITGIVSMGGAALALALHNRFLVYPIVYILWYIPSTIDISIIYAIQPFTEYSLLYSLPTVWFVIGINIAAVIFAYIKVIKYEQV